VLFFALCRFVVESAVIFYKLQPAAWRQGEIDRAQHEDADCFSAGHHALPVRESEWVKLWNIYQYCSSLLSVVLQLICQSIFSNSVLQVCKRRIRVWAIFLLCYNMLREYKGFAEWNAGDTGGINQHIFSAWSERIP
jgi:hypothetical protein